ncbi:MAG TPA: DUF4350 domain-containing protein [Pyrinomonadaceae bacterium]|jgi:unsaturated rhamnogalacturonyl hydrolase
MPPFAERSRLVIVGLFLLSAVFFAYGQQSSNAKTSRTVVLDDYFNHEIKKDANGRDVVWHYKWDETDNGGFSLWADTFRRLGGDPITLSKAPTATDLKTAGVYIIVDPDTAQETPAPNFIEQQHIKAIADWVRQGGVLVLMANDRGNCEFTHLNELAATFGIKFNEDSLNKVDWTNYQGGRVTVTRPNPIFTTAQILFLKEISSITTGGSATAVVSQNGKTLMATAKFGKGIVFAVGDPWFYNEYTDGYKLPAEYENVKAMEDLSRWLLAHAKR